MKRVIFVGGTAYSGSTFFDMTLANDPKGLSIGEVNAVFHPYRIKHLNVEGLSAEIDWRRIKNDGPQNLYTNLFELFPEIDFIVDSSKSALWISQRTRDLEEQNIEVSNILIWKYPAEFKKSRVKRGRNFRWVAGWVNYHQYYISVVKNWRSVKYSEYARDPETLKQICRVMGLNFFEGKERFWEKKQYTLYGNASAKIHLTDSTSKEYSEYQSEIKTTATKNESSGETEITDNYKKIYYDESANLVNDEFLEDIRFKKLLEMMEYANVKNYEFDSNVLDEMKKDINVSQLYKTYQLLKQRCRPVTVFDSIFK